MGQVCFISVAALQLPKPTRVKGPLVVSRALFRFCSPVRNLQPFCEELGVVCSELSVGPIRWHRAESAHVVVILHWREAHRGFRAGSEISESCLCIIQATWLRLSRYQTDTQTRRVGIRVFWPALCESNKNGWWNSLNSVRVGVTLWISGFFFSFIVNLGVHVFQRHESVKCGKPCNSLIHLLQIYHVYYTVPISMPTL